jgi:hemolysin activation/secretion protein
MNRFRNCLLAYSATAAVIGCPATARAQEGEWVVGFADAPAASTSAPSPRPARLAAATLSQPSASSPATLRSPTRSADSSRAIASVKATGPVGGIAISGAEMVDPARFAPLIEARVGQNLAAEDLEKLTNEIAEIAREEGMLFPDVAAATTPDAFGIMRITVRDGVIDALDIISEGDDGRDESQLAWVRQRLEPLVGAALTRKEVERMLLLLSDAPGLRYRGSRYVQKDGKNILRIWVEKRGIEGRLTLDNYGSESFGPVRARLAISLHGLLGDSDVFTASVRTNPIEPNELLFFQASYAAMVSRDGLLIGFTGAAGRNAPDSDLTNADLTGQTLQLGINASYPLIRSNALSIWAEGDASFLEITRDSDGAMIRRDSVTTLRLGLRGEFPLIGGRLRLGGGVTRGFELLDATRRGDPLASNSDGDGVFTKVDLWSDYSANLAGRLSLYLSARGQFADRPLLSVEEISIGGADKVRGFDFAELSGDNGLYGLAELRYAVPSPDWLKRLQLYGFVDGGYVDDIDRSTSEGSLFSTGPGLRAGLGPVDLEFESAFPVNTDRASSGGRDPHLNLRIGLSF